MNKTKLCDYSKEAQDHIKKEAERVGVSVDRVLENVDALSAGLGPIYRDPVFSKGNNEHAKHQQTITFIDEPNAVTIRITGKAFDNLKEITAIFNKWDDADNTPADIANRFLCAGDGWGCLDDKQPEPLNQTLPGMMCCAFSEEKDMPELERAFKAAGFLTSR